MALLEKQEKVYQEFERKHENTRVYVLMRGNLYVARLIFEYDHKLTLYCHFIGLPMLKGVFLTDHEFSQEGVLLRQTLEDAKTNPAVNSRMDPPAQYMDNVRFLMDQNQNARSWKAAIAEGYTVLNVIVG